MDKQFKAAFDLIAAQDVEGCITGSYMLGYKEDWHQDLDCFMYSEQSFTALLYFMKYNSLFQILSKIEQHKIDDYLQMGKSSLDKLHLITIKFYYNTCVPINVIYKKGQKNVFDVVSNFDLDIITTGYDIKTGKTLSLRETTDMNCTWNKWNNAYYKSDLWSCKRLLRQFSRICKYTQRGYDVSSVTDKYIELVEDILSKDNIYKSEKGLAFYNNIIDEFKIVLKILQEWKRTLTITPEELSILETII